MRGLALIAVALTGFAASASLAQLPRVLPPTVDREVLIPSSQENLNARKVREGMIKFARCVARRRPVEAADFVWQVSQRSWTALEKRIDDDCALAAVDDPNDEVRVSTNSQDLLFALAEVLAQKMLRSVDPAQIKAAAPLPPADSLATVGECAVRADPIGAKTLLETRLNSTDERQALQALAPAFASCLPQGMEVRFDATTMRGAVAVNLYRLSKAGVAAPSEEAAE